MVQHLIYFIKKYIVRDLKNKLCFGDYKMSEEKKDTKTSITQEDLDNLIENINEVIDNKLEKFVDDFFDAWEESEEISKKNKCTCEEEIIDNPRRYHIVAGGHDYWVDDFKPNAISAGIDVIWTEELGGKTKIVRGTISSPDVSIFDYENDMDLEVFSAIKKQTIDYAIQFAQEAQAREKAKKLTENTDNPVDATSHVSYG